MKEPNFFADRFGVDAARCRRVMSEALARGGEYCDLFFQQRTASTIGLEDDQVDRASRSADLGVGVRVLAGDAAGYAFCEDLDERTMIDAARVAAEIARGGRAHEPVAVADPVAAVDRYPVARPWSGVTTEEKIPILSRLNTQARAAEARVQKVRVRFSDAESHVLIVDSEGRATYDYQPMTVTYVFCVAERGTQREEAYASRGGRYGFEHYDEPTLGDLATLAAGRAVRLLDAVRPPPGEQPVVLAAGGSGILLHEAIGHGMEADFCRKGVSIYSDRVGQPIAAPFVSIVDDGTIESARGTINVDDEGNAPERTVLVEDGVLRTFLHDRISARHYGVGPTGSGRRQSFRHRPLPRMRTTYMRPGPHARDEIIRSVKRGVYAESFTNGQVQIGAGDFTFYIKTGYLIEDGRLTAPIKDANLIGNGPQVLADIEMVGDDLEMDPGGWTCGKDGQSVPVSLGMPTAKIKAIAVGGA